MKPKPNPTPSALKQRQWRLDNPEKARANSKRYKEKPGNKEKQAELNRAWVKENRDHVRAVNYAWRAANPDKIREQYTKQNRQRRVGRDADDVFYADVLRSDPCAYCGGPASTVDHVVPLSEVVDNDWTNLTAACMSCNSSKGSKSLLLWMAARPISTCP